MGRDSALITRNEIKRDFTGVLHQQGRVTLEADLNEAEAIAAEELRKDVLAFVGRDGTPDGGYLVGKPPAGSPSHDFAVSKGTLYMGGIRVRLTDPNFVYSKQDQNWTDRLYSGDWVAPGVAAPSHNGPITNELICARVDEHELSAVEDKELYEPALGGPDTSQRLLLTQRVVRFGVGQGTCDGARAELTGLWNSIGLTYDYDGGSLRLESGARLKVSLAGGGAATSDCDPPLDSVPSTAENQLIRVQITDPAGGSQRFLWAIDNASSLYRAAVHADRLTVDVSPLPVDADHVPQPGWTVEFLRSTASIDGQGWVAAASGFLTTVQSYDAATLTVHDLVPADMATAGGPQVFMRVWRNPPQTIGATPTTLGSTQVQVQITPPAAGAFRVGDYWTFAVRPNVVLDGSATTAVLPQRYVDSPQPPDGPRIWICPLAVAHWDATGLVVDEVCRSAFENLVDLTSRHEAAGCTQIVQAKDVTASNDLVKILEPYRHRVTTISLGPGTYTLYRPLVLTSDFAGLTIESCPAGAVLKAGTDKPGVFDQGMIVLNQANNVTFRGLRFQMPAVPFTGRLAGLGAGLATGPSSAQNKFAVSIAIRAIQCADLKVEDCGFDFPAVQAQGGNSFGAAVFAGGASTGHTIVRNQFVLAGGVSRAVHSPFSALYGYLAMPAVVIDQKSFDVAKFSFGRGGPAGLMLVSSLENLRFEENSSVNLDAAFAAQANLNSIYLRRNRVRFCDNGFILMSNRGYVLQLQGGAGDPKAANVDQFVAELLGHIGSADTLSTGLAIAGAYPLPPGVDPNLLIRISSARGNIVKGVQAKQVFRRNVSQLLGQKLTIAGGAPAGGTTRTVPSGPILGVQRLGPIQAILNQIMTSFAIKIEASPLVAELSENDVDLILADGQSAFGLLLWDDERETDSSLVLSANRMRTNSPTTPSALVALVENSAVTGNVIQNLDVTTPARAMILLPAYVQQVAGAAITGNVFQAAVTLPARPSTIPGPMSDWRNFNALV
jgi:hypothetical protein